MRRGWLRRLLLCPPLLCMALMTGCLYHTRKLQPVKPPQVEITTDATQLAKSINQINESIQTLSATVDMQASVGGTRKGAVTDYASFRGFVQIRKPEMLRVLGLLPVLQTRAFDMVSNGNTFKLLIPPKNEAVEGKNSVTTKSENPLMNLRPGLFFDSMLMPAIQPDDQLLLTTDNVVNQDPKTKKFFEARYYLLWVVRSGEPGKGLNLFREVIPERVIRFDRENLQPIEQDIYDRQGKHIETITLYGPLQSFGSERFPGTITIKRPLEEYQIVLTVQKLVVNQPLADDQFELDIPEGVQINKLD